MKKLQSQLALRRETIRLLCGSNLSRAAGGNANFVAAESDSTHCFQAEAAALIAK